MNKEEIKQLVCDMANEVVQKNPKSESTPTPSLRFRPRTLNQPVSGKEAAATGDQNVGKVEQARGVKKLIRKTKAPQPAQTKK